MERRKLHTEEGNKSHKDIVIKRPYLERLIEISTRWEKTKKLNTRPPFENLFPIQEKMIKTIQQNMENYGYDGTQAIVLWDEDKRPIREGHKGIFTVIDGHCRLIAAKRAKIREVSTVTKKFENEQKALEYAIHNQRDRRNMTDADILRCIEVVDERRQQGERTDLRESTFINLNKSSEPSHVKTARVVGVTPSKVQKARSVIDHADEETKQDVLEGRRSIHNAAEETKEKRAKHGVSETTKKSDAVTKEEVGQIKKVVHLFDHLSEQIYNTRIKLGRIDLLKRNGSRYEKVVSYMRDEEKENKVLKSLMEATSDFSKEWESISGYMDKLSKPFK